MTFDLDALLDNFSSESEQGSLVIEVDDFHLGDIAHIWRVSASGEYSEDYKAIVGVAQYRGGEFCAAVFPHLPAGLYRIGNIGYFNYRQSARVVPGEVRFSDVVGGGARMPLKVPSKEEAITLSKRQREILALISTGITPQEVAQSLSISLITVQNHLHHIRQKLGVKNLISSGARTPTSARFIEKVRQQRFKSCFVAAPSGTNLSTIISILEELEIEPVIPSVLSVPGETLLEYVAAAIAAADLMVAIIGTEDEDTESDVLFELGQAHALKKQILVVVQPEAKKLPALVRELLYLRTGLENRDAIRFALEQLMRRPRGWERSQNRPLMVRSVPIGPLADVLLDRLNEFPNGGTEHQLIEILEEAFRAGGISIIEQRSTPEPMRNDLAVWSDDIALSLGGPLLIEVRKSLDSDDQVDGVRNQVLSYVDASDVAWALVVFEEAWTDTFDPLAASLPMVLFFRLSSLIDSLRTQNFTEILLDWRNRVAHVEVAHGVNIES